MGKIVAFSKYDPEPQESEEDNRRAQLLKIGSWISLAYVVIGFLFIGIILTRGKLF